MSSGPPRAVQRSGELLQQLKADKGAARRGPGSPSSTRKAEAQSAGLTPDQAKQMLRVANVPKDQFEATVEASKPATVKQLAEAGTKKQEKPKAEPYRNEWIDWTGAVEPSPRPGKPFVGHAHPAVLRIPGGARGTDPPGSEGTIWLMGGEPSRAGEDIPPLHPRAARRSMVADRTRTRPS